MPIKGLTDKPQRFSEIGQLRKGAPKPEKGNRPGKDLTYFRATFLEGEERAAEMFHAEYGDEPREINILLPFDTVDENLEAWNEAYVASTLLHRCNGDEVIYAIDPKTGEVLVQNGHSVQTGETVKCDGKPITHWTDRNGKEHPVYCEPHVRLRVIVPELRRLAFVTVLSTSTWDAYNLSTQLAAVRDMNKGTLRGVPLVLKRRPYWKSTPSGPNGKKARRKMWLLSVEADPAWVDAQLTAMKAATLPNGEATLSLPPGVPDTNGSEEPVEGEYEIQEGGRVWEDERPAYEAEELLLADESEYEIDEIPDDDAPEGMETFYDEAEERLGISKPDAIQTIIAFLEGEHGEGATIKAYVSMAGNAGAASYFWRILKGTLEPSQEEFPF